MQSSVLLRRGQRLIALCICMDQECLQQFLLGTTKGEYEFRRCRTTPEGLSCKDMATGEP